MFASYPTATTPTGMAPTPSTTAPPMTPGPWACKANVWWQTTRPGSAADPRSTGTGPENRQEQATGWHRNYANPLFYIEFAI